MRMGFYSLQDALTRVIIKIDHKVSLDVIDTKIKKAEPVQDAAAVSCALDDKVVVFLKLKENYAPDKLKSLLDSNTIGLSFFEKPDHIEILNELPYMNNGKINYIELEKIANKLS